MARQGEGLTLADGAMLGSFVKWPARNYTFYMFYTDKSNGQGKGEIL